MLELGTEMEKFDPNSNRTSYSAAPDPKWNKRGTFPDGGGSESSDNDRNIPWTDIDVRADDPLGQFLETFDTNIADKQVSDYLSSLDSQFTDFDRDIEQEWTRIEEKQRIRTKQVRERYAAMRQSFRQDDGSANVYSICADHQELITRGEREYKRISERDIQTGESHPQKEQLRVELERTQDWYDKNCDSSSASKP